MGFHPKPWKFFEKNLVKLLVKCNFIAFSRENYKLCYQDLFFQTFSNKIFIALILNRKSCICCRKHCIAYFRRHMECAVLKRFLKVQGTFSIKKFLQIPLSIWKKLNLIRFIKALIKGFTPHLLRLRLSTFSTREKALNPFHQTFGLPSSLLWTAY